MALDLGELVGSIGMDINPLERSLSDADGLLSDFAQEGSQLARRGAEDIAREYGLGLAEVARLMDAMPQDARGAVDETSAAFQALPADVQSVMRAVEADVDRMLEDIGAGGRQAGDDLSSGFRQGMEGLPQHARRAADDAVGDLRTGLADAEPAAEQAADEAGEGFSTKFTAAMKGAGLAGGAAVMAGLAVGAAGASELDSTIDRITAQFGLSQQEAAAASEAAATIYANNWGESLEEVSGGIGQVMASLGVAADSPELADLTAAAFTLADVFDVDVSAAARAAGTAVKNGLARDGVEAFDLLAAAGRGMSEEVFDELLSAVAEYGVAIGGLGIPAEAAFSAMRVAAESQGAIGLDRVGDAFNELNVKMAETDEAAYAALGSIGLRGDEVGAAFRAGGEDAKAAFAAIVEGLLGIEDSGVQATTTMALFGAPLVDLGQQLMPEVLEALSQGEGALGDFSGAAEDMGEALGDNASAKISTFKRNLEIEVVQFIRDEVIPQVVELAETIEEYAGPAFDTVREAVENALPTLQDFIDEVERVLEENGPEIEEFAGQLGETVATLASTVGTVAQAITLLWGIFGDNVLGSTLRTFGNIGTIIQGALDIVSGIVGFWLAVFTGDWSGAMESFQQGWSGTWAVVTGIFWQAVELVTAPVRALASLLGIDTNRMWDNITGAASRGVAAVVGWFGSLRTRGVEMFGSLKTGAMQRGAELLAWVSGLPGQILQRIGNLGSLLFGVGEDVVRGMWNGLQSMGNWLKDQLWDWIKDVIPGPVQHALGIASPSKVMRALLRWVPIGMAEGLMDGAPAVDEAMAELSRRASNVDVSLPDPAGFSMPVPASSYPTAAASVEGAAVAAGLTEADLERLVMRVVELVGGDKQITLVIGTEELATWLVRARQAEEVHS